MIDYINQGIKISDKFIVAMRNKITIPFIFDYIEALKTGS